MRAVEFRRVDLDPGSFHRAGDPIVIGEMEHTSDVEQDGVERFGERHRGIVSARASATLTGLRKGGGYLARMEFRRIHALPPYAFAEIDALGR